MERKKGLLAAGCLLAVGAAAAVWFGLADEDHTLSEADAAEFCLQNGTGMQLDTGGVNRLEKRTGDGWEAVCGSTEAYPPGSHTLSAGETLYGMTGWPEAGITLSAGEYRYQMVVCLYGEEGRMPVIVEDIFTIG